MVPMLANCFFLLLFLALVAKCQVPDHPVNVTVSIQNKMGGATTLSVHCRSQFHGIGVPIIDLREHLLGDEQRYNFILLQPYPAKLDRQVYHCTFNAQGYPKALMGVYWGKHYPHWSGECVNGQCPLWTVTPEGFFCNGVDISTWAMAATSS